MPNWVANTVKVEDLNAVVGKFIRKPTQEEVDKYAWEKDKFGKWTNVPVDDSNHLMDAMRYSVEDYIVKNSIELSYRRII